MDREEVELLPAGLVTCLLNEKEVRILKISPKKLTLRLSEKVESNFKLKIAFYLFDDYRYEEVTIEDYKIREVIKEDFYLTYIIEINNKEYFGGVRKIFKEYYNYIKLKAFGDFNEFSEKMVNYPAQLDYEFFDYYLYQKKHWMNSLNYEVWNESIINSVEFALSLDNYVLYKKYLDVSFNVFKEEYLKENFIHNHKLFKGDFSRLYIGNEFCHNLFPEEELLINMLKKAKEENLEVTLCFTYMRENYIGKTKEVLNKVYNWCKENNKRIEITINDWGMVRLIENKLDYFKINLGVLLNKRKKDPRYIYKKGYDENKGLMGKNSLNSSIFNKFLKDLNIDRYEYENCGYRISIAQGKHSLHLPFYQTNTSQYCTLYAMCTTMDRGNQKLVESCPQYCKDYVFTYAKHLKMVGRYNSLFSFDDTLLKNPEELEYYINSGIDRIVLNQL